MNEIQSFKGREIDPEKPVKVYRNLTRKGTVWSVKQGQHVVAHATKIALAGCQCIINEKGQQRARQEGVRNVHAFVQGYLTDLDTEFLNRVTYNPFKHDTFVVFWGKTEESITSSGLFKFDQRGAWCINRFLETI